MYNKNAWSKYDENQLKEVFEFAEQYKQFLTFGKTERRVVTETIKIAEEHGFKDASKLDKIAYGDKVYFVNKNKNIALYVIGKQSLTKGLNILGAHIDSPRLDLKQSPLYESKGFALLDTHYYGGVKKYQWVTIPLALYGAVCKKDGTVIDIAIGDDENDPVVGISDLLIHLSADQLTKPASKVIEGENLDVTCGSIPSLEDNKSVKANILKLLKDKYDFEEEDFLSAEIEVVPAGKSRDYGLDRSMVAGYGHDDRCCAYTSLRAILDMEPGERTGCCILVDKEEIGSVGATGAQSMFFENTIAYLIDKLEGYNDLKIRLALENSYMLSSDVSAGYDPLFPCVMDTRSNNNAYLGNGICFNKYTGSRGKSGSNDCMPEYFAKVRKCMDDNDVNYQTCELGKVDQGGGGTIAYILGNKNMNVVDAGLAVLNMHAPMEIVSKADLFEAYRCYQSFLLIK